MNKNQEKSKVELIKENSCGLRGSIAEELSQEGATFSAQNTALLKFHGIYQQEDRDQRKERSRLRMDKAHQFMVRIKNPGGGKFSPEQWLALDRAADLYGNNSLRLTSRQDVQFHGVGKRNLRQLIGRRSMRQCAGRIPLGAGEWHDAMGAQLDRVGVVRVFQPEDDVSLARHLLELRGVGETGLAKTG